MNEQGNIKEFERCGKILILEEFGKHLCSPYFQTVRELMVDYSFQVNNRNGDKVSIAKGLDNGIIYRLVECKHNPTHRTNPRLKSKDQTSLNIEKSDDKLPEPL